MMNQPRGNNQNRSPFITKSLNQRLKEQDSLIQNSSPQQLLKSLEITQKSLLNSRFPQKSESAIVLKKFETQLLTRLNQLSQSPGPSSTSFSNAKPNEQSSATHSPRTPNVSPPQSRNQIRSIGSEGIVGFRRQLIEEQSFVPKTESLLATMPMSQAIRLQEQNFSRERELAATHAFSRLHLGSHQTDLKVTREDKFQEYSEHDNETDSDEIILTEDDQPDLERAWEMAYQAGFSRGQNDLPRRILETDKTKHS